MDIPRFDGTDALDEYLNCHKEQPISIASFYMDGPTLNWYQWMSNTTNCIEKSSHALQTGFFSS